MRYSTNYNLRENVWEVIDEYVAVDFRVIAKCDRMSDADNIADAMRMASL